MYCERLNLKDFRNYRRLDLSLSPGLTVFQGENAAGKTTLLEAIYLLATTKSPRAGADQELVSFEAEAEFGVPAFARLSAHIEQEEGALDAEIIVMRNEDGTDGASNAARKRIKVNGTPRRAIDLIGKINVVLFSPEDLDLVIGSPSLRRRYLDVTLSQIDHRYLRNWQDYAKVVAQRNGYLRNLRERRREGRHTRSDGRDELSIWNEELVKSGAYLIKRRREALHSLNERATTLHAHLTGLVSSLLLNPTSGFELVYQPSFNLDGAEDEAAIAARFAAQLEEVRPQELKRGVSLAGPHRDDFLFTVEGSNLSIYGSRGQQRTAVLALKLAEVGWMEAQTGEQPILLLDDILSELDASRRQYVLDTVITRAQQSLITTTDLAYFPDQERLREIATLYQVEGGRVIRV
ncbi:MAG TPA: DNA replication/repair protein RecF [Chloroflexia bacterium]|nr:DNA replication/repair protein RecF [Chloroflexia bacterium]